MGRPGCVTAMSWLMIGVAAAAGAAPIDADRAWEAIGVALHKRIVVYTDHRLWSGTLRELRSDSLFVETERFPVLVSSDQVCLVVEPGVPPPGARRKAAILIAASTLFGWWSFRCDRCSGKLRAIGALFGAAAGSCYASLFAKQPRVLYRSPEGCPFKT